MGNQIQWFPGHMKKALDEIKERLSFIDIVIEIVDSRCPTYSRNPLLDTIIGTKPKMTIALKRDLADPRRLREAMEKYPEIIFSEINDRHLKDKVISKIQETGKVRTERLKRKGMKNPKTRVLIVGLPNIGKSSIINKLANRKAAKVENRPGVTKHQQWVKLGENIDLFDTPGVLWPKFEDDDIAISLVLINCIKKDILPMDEICQWIVNLLVTRYKEQFKKHFKISDEDIEGGYTEIMNAICMKNGLIRKGGVPDEQRGIDLLIKETQASKVTRFYFE